MKFFFLWKLSGFRWRNGKLFCSMCSCAFDFPLFGCFLSCFWVFFTFPHVFCCASGHKSDRLFHSSVCFFLLWSILSIFQSWLNMSFRSQRAVPFVSSGFCWRRVGGTAIFDFLFCFLVALSRKTPDSKTFVSIHIAIIYVHMQTFFFYKVQCRL